MAAASRSKSSVDWRRAAPAPVVVLLGSADLLADRATQAITAQLRQQDPNLEISYLDASADAGGQLALLTSPSLFDESRCVMVESAAHPAAEFVADLVDYVRDPQPNATVLLRHRGGTGGRKVIDTVRSAGFPVVACDEPKRDSDRVAFAQAEFRDAGRRADAQAIRSLVDATGSDVAELAAACHQLMADTDGPITVPVVDRYYAGRIEASGFKVADAAVAGDAAGAIVLLRHALATGVDPVPIVAALAGKLRVLAKVAGAKRAGIDTGSLGLAPWQIDKARRELRRWDAPGMARAIEAVAQADAEIKGAGRAPMYSVEQAVLTVADAAKGAGQSARR